MISPWYKLSLAAAAQVNPALPEESNLGRNDDLGCRPADNTLNPKRRRETAEDE
jgi:hypothetical protein